MIDAAIAHLAVDPDDERRPDHGDVAVDFDRGIGDAFAEALARLEPRGELRPAFLAEASPGAECTHGGDPAVGINDAKRGRGVARLEGREKSVDRREYRLLFGRGRRECLSGS